MRSPPLLILAAALALAGCASSGSAPKSAETASSGDELGLTGAETGPELKIIAAAPYLLSADPRGCLALSRELAAIDRLVGPDLDSAARPERDAAAEAVAGAVRGAIPYRWALRWMTQAARRDRERAAAVQAATARRGFLRGVSQALDCDQVTPASARFEANR